ncbi:MAG: glycosyltransferase, partial [Chloroflexales bacterium]
MELKRKLALGREMTQALRIGIDARLVTYRRGMGNVVYHLLHAIAATDSEHYYMLYVDDPAAANVLPKTPRFTMRVLRPALYPLWEQVLLPLAAHGDRIDVLHCPANTGPLNRSSSVGMVLTVHDVMYMLPASQLPSSSSLYQRMGRLYRRLIVPSAVRRASAIMTDSEHSRQDIVRLIGAPPCPMTVVPLAPGTVYQSRADLATIAAVRAAYGLKQPFILTLGGIDPRKNTARVIEAFAQLCRRVAQPPLLAVVGLPPAG